MKRTVLSLVLVALTAVVLLAQSGATRVISSGTLPTSCSNGAVYVKTGASKGWYVCDSGTWVGPYPTTDSGSGAVVQVVNTQTGSHATGTTTIPIDDTIPQITEGTEFMTLAITPTSSSNKLRIDVMTLSSHSANSANIITALFQDSTANALAATTTFALTATGMVLTNFTHYMTAGTTSSTTFRVRIGSNQTGTLTFNGASGGRFLGGVIPSSITITEIVP